MRLLPLLKESVLNETHAWPFKLSPAITKSATIGDLFSKFRGDNTISLELVFGPSDRELILRYTFRSFERDTAVLMSFSAFDSANQIDVELDLSQVNSSERLRSGENKYVDKGAAIDFSRLRFNGVLPYFDLEVGKENSNLLHFFEKQRTALRTLENVYWLGPLRKSIGRIERFIPATNYIGPNGEGASQILFDDSLLGGPIFREVSEWFEKNCNVSLDVVRSAHEFGALASLALVRGGDVAVRVPLEDAGEGMSQVLPVLTYAAMAAHGRLGYDPLIMIEHPDLHLHSNAHFAVVEYLVRCAQSEYRPRFVIESHSEAVLTSTQLMLIDSKLRPSDFIAYHVVSEIGGSAKANAVELQENGESINGKFGTFDWFTIANRKAVELARKKIAG